MSGPQKSGGSIRTPLGRVRHLGSAKHGTGHFWQQRLTSVALIPLSIGFVVLIVSLLGRNHAAVVQILGSPLVAIGMLLFIGTTTYHMWLGMQTIIEDYVHEELPKLLTLMANTFFCCATGVAAGFAVLKLSFGV
jgi:succinate dehydrogenase / fumarate reductase membrane anchor subunit